MRDLSVELGLCYFCPKGPIDKGASELWRRSARASGENEIA